MPILYSPDGAKYRTENPAEIIRLKSAGYSENPVTASNPEPEPEVFHPEDHNINDVLTYMAEHPTEIERVLAEEKSGKARPRIVGDSA